MSTAFRYLKAACPVCDGARRDCRQSVSTGAIHCRANVTPIGWEAQGFDSQGFVIWVRGIESTDPAFWVAREQQRAERERQQAEARKRLLSLEERDRQWRIVARYSGLARRHRQKLEERCIRAGLGLGTIDRLAKELLLWTWQPGQEFPGVTAALPGTDRRGRLRKHYQGFAIAVPNAAGQILGCQIKIDGGTYIWASSGRSGNGPYLPNGELPMGVYWPSELRRTDRIFFSEGYLKAALHAEQVGGVVVGMAGGNFAGVQQQIDSAIPYVREQLRCQKKSS